jgi:alpha-galactosidase
MIIPFLVCFSVSHQQLRTILLQDLDLRSMIQDWGPPQAAKSTDGHPLKIGGKTFAAGVGTHAHSEYSVNLFGSAKKFSATVGVDDETGGRGTVRFMIYVDNALVSDTGVMKGGDPAKPVSVDLTGRKTLRLVVDDAGDGIDYDHADWAEASITYTDPQKKPVAFGSSLPEPTMKIYHGTSTKPEINGARIVGATPGRDFLFRVPVSGQGPFTFISRGMPAGLTLDQTRGLITGQLEASGSYPVQIIVFDKRGGRDSRTLTIVGGQHMLALTPPMGWNSWNVWGTSVDANKVRAAADAFIKTGLANAGYTYVNIDDAWEGGRDKSGEIQTNEKFGDMQALGTYVHSLGIKLGIYSSPGPKTCAGYEASYQHEEQDAKTYAKWGVDYLKYDWCSYGGIAPRPSLADMQKPYAVMRKALDDCGRDIVFSFCQYGMGDVFDWGKELGGNLWRTTGDITDTWSSMSGIGFSHSPKAVGAGPGGWNDPDMLVVGKLGWGDHPRPTRLKPNEQITHISLWAMLGAPLIIGCDLTQLDEFTKDLLTNHDIIEIDQDPLGKVATLKKKEGTSEIWTRPLFDGTVAVGLFNRAPQKTRIVVHWSDIGLQGTQPVRDLWLRRNLRAGAVGYAFDVPGHGAVVIKVGKPKAE